MFRAACLVHFVERAREIVARARQHHAGAIEFLGRLIRGDPIEKLLLAFKRRHARRAIAQVRFDVRALLRIEFIGNVQQQALGHIRHSGARLWREGALRFGHSSPPNCARNFRVARNNEFFTVSSVVPSVSPIARNFNPW